MRRGELPPRRQSSVAVSPDGLRWSLVNASPDLSRQIESFFPPDPEGPVRQSFLHRVFLTNADLDHTLGLFQLREGARFGVTAPHAVWVSLQEGLRIEAALQSYSGIDFSPASPEWQGDLAPGLEVRTVPLDGTEPPRFAAAVGPGTHAVGYLFREREGGRQVGIFPDVAELNDHLKEELEGCDLIFFDGTFWRDEELIDAGVSDRTSRQMGHVPISGPEGSLAFLRQLKGPACHYLHINNTNPILNPRSKECTEVERAGLHIAEDGASFEL